MLEPIATAIDDLRALARGAMARGDLYLMLPASDFMVRVGRVEVAAREAIESAKAATVDGSLEAARAATLAGADDGSSCPCCGRLVQRYRPRMRRSEALWLLALYSISPTEYVHIEQIQAARVQAKIATTHNDDYHLLARRGLTEAGERAGLWRLTEKGRLFAQGRTTIPERVIHCCGKVEGFEGAEIAIRYALDASDFDYLRDVVGRVPAEAPTEDAS